MEACRLKYRFALSSNVSLPRSIFSLRPPMLHFQSLSFHFSLQRFTSSSRTHTKTPITIDGGSTNPTYLDPFKYADPNAFGPSERPTNPASARIVSTYGAMSKKTDGTLDSIGICAPVILSA